MSSPKPIKKITALIPCYNEEKNIALMADRFNEARPKKLSVELILVDNGSTDKTNEEIKKIAR